MVENLEGMICVFDVGRQRSDERSHVFVRKARNQFSWVAASGNYGSPRVVGLVDLVTYLHNKHIFNNYLWIRPLA